MAKFTFNVIQTVEVDLDDTKITEEFMEHFSSYMWQVDDLEEIARHVAWNKALFDGYACEGVPAEFYTAKVVEQDVEVV
ncbi:MAG: hypothetical protein ACRC6V_01550 [Bacteroidales bacterium]